MPNTSDTPEAATWARIKTWNKLLNHLKKLQRCHDDRHLAGLGCCYDIGVFNIGWEAVTVDVTDDGECCLVGHGTTDAAKDSALDRRGGWQVESVWVHDTKYKVVKTTALEPCAET